VLALMALSEYYSALQTTGVRPNVALGWACAVAMLLVTQRGELLSHPGGVAVPVSPAATNALQYTLMILFVCITGTLMAQFSRRPGQSAVVNSATTVFGVVYVGLLLSFVLRMRYMDLGPLTGNAGETEFARRMGALILVAGPVWLSDTAAFMAGNLWGRHKLAPTISPHKTVEGAAAGFAAAILGTLVVGAWLSLPWAHRFALGALMGVVGPLGDLGKSVLKRDLGVKDFGSVFGPHGGVLDRFDAILFCMPLVYWYLWILYLKLPSA
jgi:phosphatidate cytidylyltransferase